MAYTTYQQHRLGILIDASLWSGFRYDLGKGPAKIRSKEKLDLNKWHDIIATRVGFRGVLQIDNKNPVKGQPASPTLTQLNVNNNLYFGSVPGISRGYVLRSTILDYHVVTTQVFCLSV